MSFVELFQKQQEALIEKLGPENAYLVWSMSLYLEEPDVEKLASEALTDGANDRKIDFIYIDLDAKKLVFAQGYFSSKNNDSAPANKASDLNTASAWLLSGDLDHVPDKLKQIIVDCREAIKNGDVEGIELIYNHNLPESVNVARELQTVEDHFRKALGDDPISVRAFELGLSKVEHLHSAQETQIRVKDAIPLPTPVQFKETGPDWTASVSSVPGAWLHELYTKYSDDLFSANYRGFLGITRRRRINTGIRQSAETQPQDFWAFNNGITILTLSLEDGGKGKAPILNGISIINGAQTTGSLGAIDSKKVDLSGVRVLARIIECSDSDKIDSIVRYNNTQNEITTWDKYSNDQEQKRIDNEFTEIGFSYNRKRGFASVGEQLGIEEVAQPLLAFHGRPQDAIRGKNQIFDRKPLYDNAFENKKARHILFVFTLGRAIDEKRISLKAKSNANSLIQIEEEQLNLLRNLRFKAFMIAVVAGSLESAIGTKCDLMTVAFSPDASKGHTLVELVARWGPIVDSVLAFIIATADVANFSAKFSDDEYLKSVTRSVSALLHAGKFAETNKDFAALVSAS